jgi:hypothetical protein
MFKGVPNELATFKRSNPQTIKLSIKIAGIAINCKLESQI